MFSRIVALFALCLAFCAPAGALRVTGVGSAPTLTGAVAHSRTVSLATPTVSHTRSAAPHMLAGKVEVSPLMAVFAFGGTAGVFFAAFCTSNGSPPTGLAVGLASCIFMAAGATLIENDGLPKQG